MKPATDVSIAGQGHETWLPLLQIAAEEVFEIMLGAKLEPLAEAASVPAAQITAMVGLAGQLCGVMTLRCMLDAAKLIAAKMLGISPDQADQQLWDAIGEICNMVAGNFKNKLTGLSDKCMLSVPTVITGGDYTFRSLADAGTMEIMMAFATNPILIALEVLS